MHTANERSFGVITTVAAALGSGCLAQIEGGEQIAGLIGLLVRLAAGSFIIAATTANAATKIAYGIIDTPMLVVINHSLMAGKPVICSSNGANPDDPERAQAGMRFSPEGYREMMLEHLQKMEKLGITVTDAESLCRVCSEKVKA